MRKLKRSSLVTLGIQLASSALILFGLFYDDRIPRIWPWLALA